MSGPDSTRRQLTFDDRLFIERGLNRGDRVSWIAKSIDRSPKVVSAEIKRNWTDDPRGMLVVNTRNICVHFAQCERRGLCKSTCRARCSRCKDWLCNSLCPDFEAKPCERLNKSPYCCNACPERIGGGCRHPYRFYEAKYADDLAQCRRKEAREGIDCEPEAFEKAIKIIEEGLKLGQSPEHIIAANPGDIPFGSRSLYNYLAGAKMGSLSKLNLPKAVRYKPRKRSGKDSKQNIPRQLLDGRKWSDFCELSEEDRINAVEMDTVVGRVGKDEQCILTLYVRRIRFQFYILLPRKSSDAVIKALDQLQDICGKRFSRTFGLILTDRGTEFANPERMECARNGVKRSSIYYCDPVIITG